MLSFEIGQQEIGFYSERTESQTDRITKPSSSVLVYRYTDSQSCPSGRVSITRRRGVCWGGPDWKCSGVGPHSVLTRNYDNNKAISNLVNILIQFIKTERTPINISYEKSMRNLDSSWHRPLRAVEGAGTYQHQGAQLRTTQ